MRESVRVFLTDGLRAEQAPPVVFILSLPELYLNAIRLQSDAALLWFYVALKLRDLELIILPLEIHNAECERARLELDLNLFLRVRFDVFEAI